MLTWLAGCSFAAEWLPFSSDYSVYRFWRQRRQWIKKRGNIMLVTVRIRTPSNRHRCYYRQSCRLLDTSLANQRPRYCYPSTAAVINDVDLSTTNKPSPLSNRYCSSLPCCCLSPLSDVVRPRSSFTSRSILFFDFSIRLILVVSTVGLF